MEKRPKEKNKATEQKILIWTFKKTSLKIKEGRKKKKERVAKLDLFNTNFLTSFSFLYPFSCSD